MGQVSVRPAQCDFVPRFVTIQTTAHVPFERFAAMPGIFGTVVGVVARRLTRPTSECELGLGQSCRVFVPGSSILKIDNKHVMIVDNNTVTDLLCLALYLLCLNLLFSLFLPKWLQTLSYKIINKYLNTSNIFLMCTFLKKRCQVSCSAP